MNRLPVNILKRIFDLIADENDLLPLYFCSNVCITWCQIINFYEKYISADEEITRCKICSGKIKFYSESQYLKTISFNDDVISDVIRDCLMPSIGPQLLRIQFVEVYNEDAVDELINFKRYDDNFHLTHLHLENVVIKIASFLPICTTFASSLTHFYLRCGFSSEEMENNLEKKENNLLLSNLIEGISRLINLCLLDLKDLSITAFTAPDANADQLSSLLSVVSRHCPYIENLSLSETIPTTNDDVIAFLKSENTAHLKCLSFCNPSITDGIEKGLTMRMEHFEKRVPPLIIFASGTLISEELSNKYKRPESSGFMTNEEEILDQYENGKIYIDILPVPPYGCLEKYPFHRSFAADWPPSPDSHNDNDSSISGGGFGCHSHLQDDFDYYDGEFSGEEDDDFEYDGDDDFYQSY